MNAIPRRLLFLVVVMCCGIDASSRAREHDSLETVRGEGAGVVVACPAPAVKQRSPGN